MLLAIRHWIRRSVHMATTPVTRKIGGSTGSRQDRLRMPHERDESATQADDPDRLDPVQAEQMEQARRDTESEQQNTDCRSQPQEEGSACPPLPDDSIPAKGDRPGPR
jgi:hypothetical protein